MVSEAEGNAPVKPAREPRAPREPRPPREPRENRETRPPRERPAAEPREETAEPMAASVEVAPQPVAMTPIVVPQAAPTPPVVASPQISLELPPDSNLVLVETRHPAPMPGDEQQMAKPKRVRPPRVEIVSEPLEIVETRKETPPAAP